ncbi:5'-methylthioadenosine/adenosylhomocysteine nucleosidase [Croceitalea vernalis]|uniref:adenosylhomocysteine nucleosidase n=1 Tax=Croceitalea vernalis TaxID=3075599 RepID=A0ABU3BHB3_9FLAO|nr:5'-methylthioadenosine/adenosylhomocysteine nucleosidase [Croceitalea sp. P007]MDT0621561.1 5'-methylthioadenosine/adenosylhomocysteine nucleosidase [Croceitalea sp. P007]
MALKQTIVLAFFFVIYMAQGQRVAIMGAMDKEIEFLKSELENKKKIQKSGVTFFTGKLKNKRVVLFKSGVGKVNASYCTAILVENFNVTSLIFTGVAGGLHPEIKPGDIVISNNLIQYDFGKLKNGEFEIWPTRNLKEKNNRNPLYLDVDPVLFKKSEKVSSRLKLKPFNNRLPKFYFGTIATGDNFISDTLKAKELNTKFNAIATEMEGAAVAQICTMLNLPYIIIRSCSDNANTKAQTDYLKFVEVAAINSAHMVLGLLEE